MMDIGVAYHLLRVVNTFLEILFTLMAGLGRFLPVAILSVERPLVGESGHSKMI